MLTDLNLETGLSAKGYLSDNLLKDTGEYLSSRKLCLQNSLNLVTRYTEEVNLSDLDG